MLILIVDFLMYQRKLVNFYITVKVVIYARGTFTLVTRKALNRVKYPSAYGKKIKILEGLTTHPSS